MCFSDTGLQTQRVPNTHRRQHNRNGGKQPEEVVHENRSVQGKYSGHKADPQEIRRPHQVDSQGAETGEDAVFQWLQPRSFA